MDAAVSSVRLPVLRHDLRLLEGSPAEDGSPAWMIYDALRHRYFRIGFDTFRLLGWWKPGAELDTLVTEAQLQGLDIDVEQIQGLLMFLSANQLVQVEGPQAVKALEVQYQQSRQHWLTWLIHHYLFFRIPLWRPDAFLRKTLPWVLPLFNPRLLWSIRIIGIMGVLLVIQQWEKFSATFVHFFSWEGLVWYGLALVTVKSAHELGHAYVACRHHCRVASIGVAFLVMFPVLYTDTTDAWRLRRRRDRLAIVTAGVATELHLAMLATFAWSFLADGPLRSAAFFIATTSLVSSLAINLSPFMRFDGYFALSDFLGAENLQPRSFALARWRLREALFGFGEPPPEWLSAKRAAVFLLYAYATWIYRFILFLGIAVLVYVFTFKALGIFLFLVEIVWFIAMPFKNELMQWWKRRAQLRLNRNTLMTGLGLSAMVLFLIVPWRASLSLPAVREAGAFRQVYPLEEGRIVSVLVKAGQVVNQGDTLVVLTNPQLEQENTLVEREMSLLRLRASRQASSTRELQERLVTEQQETMLATRLQVLQERKALLKIKAPITGVVSFMEDIRTNQWLPVDRLLLSVRARDGLRVVAFLPESELYRVQIGAEATWVSDLGHGQAIHLKLVRMDTAAITSLDYPELASDYGGRIAARKLSGGQMRPEQALYRLELEPTHVYSAPTLREPGILRIAAKPRSFLSEYWEYAAAVLVKESGF